VLGLPPKMLLLLFYAVNLCFGYRIGRMLFSCK